MTRELTVRAALRIAAGALLVGAVVCAAGCGDDDGGGNPMDTTLTGQDGIEASTGVMISTLTSLGAALSDVPGVGIGSRSKSAARRLALTWRDAGPRVGVSPLRALPAVARLLDACPGGGTIDESCAASGGASLALAMFDDCRGPDDENPGRTLLIDGVVSATVGDPDFCVTGEIPALTSLSLSLSNLRVTLLDDVTGDPVGRIVADYTIGVVPLGGGCAGEAGTLSMNGSLSVVSAEDAVSLALSAQNLTIAVSSSGAPCTERFALDGGISVTDDILDQHFTETFDDFVVTSTDLPNSRTSLTIDGALDVSCLGRVAFDTVTPVVIVGEGNCPIGGVIDVMLADGTVGRIAFTSPGGITLDLGADGTVEQTFEGCSDPSFARCPS